MASISPSPIRVGLKLCGGKLYGQWLAEAAVFVYDFDRFDANDILPMFKQYNITTFCAPPTMYRFMIKEDLSKFDLSSIKHACTAGEALNPEVFHHLKKPPAYQSWKDLDKPKPLWSLVT